MSALPPKADIDGASSDVRYVCQKRTFRPLFDMIDGGCTRGGITMKLPRRRFLHVAVGVAAIPAASGVAKAEVYPSRTITMIVPLPPGLGTDALARILAEHMRGTLGQSIIVENITGAGGTIGTAHVARAAPDGYTLSVGNIGTHVISPATYPNIQYHPLKDFEPVALIATSAYWLIGKNALPPKDLTELIVWLKANPDKASAAMVGTGGLDQIAGTYFRQKTGTRFQFVPYRGGAPAIQDLMAGHVDLKFDHSSKFIAVCAERSAQGLCGLRQEPLVCGVRDSHGRRTRCARARCDILVWALGPQGHAKADHCQA